MILDVNIQLQADCGAVSEALLEDHLRDIATQIILRAEQAQDNDWERKVAPGYEKEEDINLTVAYTIKKQ